jgi:hypothetical protein
MSAATVTPASVYERGRNIHTQTVARLEKRGTFLAMARLTVAGAILLPVAGVVWAHLGWGAWTAVGGLVLAFVVLAWIHARVDAAKDVALAALRFHARGLARLSLAWDELPVSPHHVDLAAHPFADDLDIFGRASVWQAVSATETRFGEEHLAKLLAIDEPSGGWPGDVAARADAARDLAGRIAFRESLAASAGVLATEKADATRLLAWAESSGEAVGPALGVVAWMMPSVAAILFAFGGVLHVPSAIRTAAVVVTMATGLAAGVRLGPLLSTVSSHEGSVTRWRATLRVIEGEAFGAPALLSVKSRLTLSARRASDEISALERIVGYVDARRNDVFRLFIGSFLLWDVHWARALDCWRARAGARLRDWLNALGEVEALASLGAFAFEHPDFAWPELVADPEFDAVGLSHPLLPADRRVGNDVRLPSAGHAWVVTGSNMSGKSTLLRAMGVNAVLAAAGAPVCARSMRIGPLRVATSMRVEDSLTGGVSHFYAELLRLKAIVDRARAPGPGAVFFLLDEVLHGTNSRERVLGACALVRDLLAHGALGAVSTHDLGIAALERELAGAVENVHFEEQVHGSTMTFDYVLRRGIVQSSNALRLMKALGLHVDA